MTWMPDGEIGLAGGADSWQVSPFHHWMERSLGDMLR